MDIHTDGFSKILLEFLTGIGQDTCKGYTRFFGSYFPWDRKNVAVEKERHDFQVPSLTFEVPLEARING